MDTGDANQDTQFQLAEDVDTKLTKWINEPTVEILKRDLESTRSAHDEHVAKVDTWTGLLHGRHHGEKRNGPYEGESEGRREKAPKGRSKVQPKLIRRQAEWRYAALSEPFLGSNKLFKVDPCTYEDAAAATQNELVLNWQFRTKLNRVKFVDDYVRSTVDEGTCIVRVGWRR